MKKLHYIFEVSAPQSPAKPLQDYIVLKEMVADCRRWVKEKLISLSGKPYQPDRVGWMWDCGSGDGQWELSLCGMMDPDLDDKIGYVALTPREGGRCTLKFIIASSE
jgi:hypothetical protein